MIRFLIFSLPLAVALFFTIGCGPKGPVTYPISGTVLFDGKPVVEGMILFTPASEKGNTGRQSSVVIVDGKFGMSSKSKPRLVQGPFWVTLDGYSEPHPGTESDPRKPLFREYNVEFDMPDKAYTLDISITKDNLKR